MMKKVEIIESALHAAQSWEDKGNVGWACTNYERAALALLSIAVCDYHTPETGIRFLETSDLIGIERRLIGLYRATLSSIEKGEVPSSVIGGNYGLIVHCHINWLLRRWDEAEEYLSIAGNPEIQELSTPFWNDYVSAVGAFIGRHRFSASELRPLRGLERHWAIHIQLFSTFANHDDPAELIDQARENLLVRNQDKRMRDDDFEIEGSFRAPAEWDFRLESILSAARDHYA